MKFHHRVRHHLKHAFIPHEHNDYKPHIFRELSIGIMLATVTSLFVISAGSAVVVEKTEYGVALMQNILIDMTNENRAADNKSFLSHNFVLDSAAAMKAENMATEGYFAHTSPKGVDPWHWFREVGYTFLYAGENLAINFTDSRAIDDAWMASPTHRANILNDKFKEIGIATYEGYYQNAQTIFVVQMFGTPAVQAKVVTPAKEEIAVKTTEPAVNSLIVAANKEEVPITEKVALVVKKPLVKQEQNVIALKASSSVEVSTSTPLGEVAGDTASSSKLIEEPKLLSVVETQNYSIVKNNEDVVEVSAPLTLPQKYSTWYERLIFGSPKYVDVFYKILIAILSVALLIMVFVEVKIRHTKNLIYGFVMFSILVGLIYLNKEIFVHNIVFLQDVL